MRTGRWEDRAVATLIQSYHLVATLLFVLISAVVSVRLLLLARRTRRKPELLLGLGVLGTAVLGYGVLIAAALVRGPTQVFTEAMTPRVLQAVGTVLHDLGVTMIVLFTLTVFRAGERWAIALAATLLAALWTGLIGWEAQNRWRSADVGNGFWWLRYAVIWSYSLWPMVESYRYYALMRRRLGLGLVDPMVTNRFFLWGTGSLGTAFAVWTASVPLLLMRGSEAALAWTPVIQIATATVGVATVIVYSLTFFPPAAYRRWVAAGTASA